MEYELSKAEGAAGTRRQRRHFRLSVPLRRRRRRTLLCPRRPTTPCGALSQSARRRGAMSAEDRARQQRLQDDREAPRTVPAEAVVKELPSART